MTPFLSNNKVIVPRPLSTGEPSLASLGAGAVRLATLVYCPVRLPAGITKLHYHLQFCYDEDLLQTFKAPLLLDQICLLSRRPWLDALVLGLYSDPLMRSPRRRLGRVLIILPLVVKSEAYP
jgi:hypothetical protein